jgi:hypothetical protein
MMINSMRKQGTKLDFAAVHAKQKALLLQQKGMYIPAWKPSRHSLDRSVTLKIFLICLLFRAQILDFAKACLIAVSVAIKCTKSKSKRHRNKLRHSALPVGGGYSAQKFGSADRITGVRTLAVILPANQLQPCM